MPTAPSVRRPSRRRVPRIVFAVEGMRAMAEPQRQAAASGLALLTQSSRYGKPACRSPSASCAPEETHRREGPEAIRFTQAAKAETQQGTAQHCRPANRLPMSFPQLPFCSQPYAVD
jgi:hypothetical protein